MNIVGAILPCVSFVLGVSPNAFKVTRRINKAMVAEETVSASAHVLSQKRRVYIQTIPVVVLVSILLIVVAQSPPLKLTAQGKWQ